ncbi:hypothetical protein HYPSUDRAFT_144230 [Hypholoma sublateritium FD-334 SS-4]|uniref:Ubiquitin 3 binding protein But2 C-terminal domain-containing protein n=1 Tax=Hypholoma sublateritium (strain FD-334 SS-4) TaxID=945553 RepID=A0A0D2M6W8_HYPSF|nr:hypothetical protein HYPSUDRAFT_144230 [Hypholoma sublateritium FD-334 SS-4]
MTATGSVSPEERLVMVTNAISTIVQFRAIDYGMERCELNFRISPATTTMFFKSTKVAVYRLASDHPLDTKKLSYSNRPSRISTIGTVSMTSSSAIEWNHEFRCTWDTISTFEFAYLGQGVEGFDLDEDFAIQWWQNKKELYPEQGKSLSFYSSE